MPAEVTREEFKHARLMHVEGIPTVKNLLDILTELIEREPAYADSYVGLKLDGADTVGTFYALTSAEVVSSSAKDGMRWIVLEGLGRLRRPSAGTSILPKRTGA